MNKLSKITLSLLTVAALSACSGSETIDLREFTEENIPQEVYVDPDGGKTYFDIASFVSWGFTEDFPAPFTVYPSSGTGGKVMSGVYVSAPENKYLSTNWWTREKYFFSARVTTSFNQHSAYHVNFTNAGGTKTFVVRKNSPSWQITNIPSWLTVSPTNGTSSTSDHNVTITAKQNSTESARYCTLSFNGTNFYVYQGSDKIDIIESSTGNSYCFLFQNGKEGQSKELTITSSADWTIEPSYSAASWLSLSTMSGKAGKTKLTLSLLKDTYSTGYPYNALIYFKIGGAIMKRIKIIAK